MVTFRHQVSSKETFADGAIEVSLWTSKQGNGLYDLAVLPTFQKKGIGKELVRRCKSACESSEWLVQTDKAKGFYEKIGIIENKDYFLTIPCKWFTL